MVFPLEADAELEEEGVLVVAEFLVIELVRGLEDGRRGDPVVDADGDALFVVPAGAERGEQGMS